MKKSNDKKKIAVVLMSKVFPQGHLHEGLPTNFVESIKAGTKKHTIRLNYDYWQRKAAKINAGEMELSIRVWEGKPYRSKQVEVARYSHLRISHIEGVYGTTDANPRLWIDNVEIANVEQVANNDGLTLADWTNYFFRTTNSFDGVILYLDDNLKY